MPSEFTLVAHHENAPAEGATSGGSQSVAGVAKVAGQTVIRVLRWCLDPAVGVGGWGIGCGGGGSG